MKEWIPVISTLAGGLIGIVGGYVAGAVQSRRQQKAERKKFLLGKLEETCNTASAVRSGIEYRWRRAIYRLNVGEELEALDDPENKRIPIERLGTLVDLYFKELKPYYGSVESGRNQFSNSLAESLKKRNASKTEGNQLKKTMWEKYNEFDNACSEFLEAASKLVERFL